MSKNIEKAIKKAIQYVREHKTWSGEHDSLALRLINHCRCGIEFADSNIADEITTLMNEWGEDNGFAEDWWVNDISLDDIFFEL